MIGGSLSKEQRHVIYHFTCCPTSGHLHSKMSWVAAKCRNTQWTWMWTIMWWHELHVMSTILPSGAERTTYCLKSTKPEATPTWVAENIKKKNIPATLDPHQYVSRTNRSTEDVISTTLHSVFTHPGESVQLHQDAVGWFHLSIQHNLTHVADWKTSHSGSRTSSTLVLDTGVPQGCVPGPLLFTPYTYNCTPRHQCNSSVKYVNHTTISGCKYIGRNLVILQSGVQRTIYCSMWAKPSMDKWSQAYPCTSLFNAILLHAKPRDCRYGKKKGRNYDS